MARVAWRSAAVIAATLTLTVSALPATQAEETSSIELESTVLADGMISVTGSVSYQADALGTVTLSSDPTGDAHLPGPASDLQAVSVTPDVANERLIVDLRFQNETPSLGLPPLTGFVVPITINSASEKGLWLGAGTEGTYKQIPRQGEPPPTSKWATMCSRYVQQSNIITWGCGIDGASGTLNPQSIRWILDGITPGSLIEQGFGMPCSGNPCILRWNGPSTAWVVHNPTDVGPALAPYVVPGNVALGVASGDKLPSEVFFGVRADFTAADSTFEGSLLAPKKPGTYTVWARTCFGLDPWNENGTCAIDGTEIVVS